MASPIEQIKEKLDLVELIQSYIRLQKAGTNYKAVCPFHKEKTPSFVVSPARQIWHCFGCGKGGDHFKFIMEHEGVEFPEALRILAKMTGVQLRREDEKARSERLKVFEILEKAGDFYRKNLAARQDALDYLFERGLKKETIADFELGYANASWDDLYHYLRGNNYSNEDIEKAGLIIRKENDSSFYDRFRSRIMFPIHDSTGSIIGFSGRIFEKDYRKSHSGEEMPAKYINTPNTIVYDKSQALYGWHRAKNEVRRRNTCVIVEGQMDLILAHQAGTQNAVAISGTALSDSHLLKIKRLTQNLIFALDADNAGLLATKRGLDSALRHGFEIKIINLENDDPADLIKKDASKWLKLLESAKPVIGYYLDFLNKRLRDERELVLAVWRVVVPYIALVQNTLDQGYWVKETAKIIKMKEEPVWEAIQKEKLKIKKEKQNSKAEDLTEDESNILNSRFKSRRDLLEERLIGLICWKSELGDVCETNWGEYFSAIRRPIFLKALNAGSNQDEHYPKKLALEAELYYTHESDFREELKKIFSELKKEHLKSEMQDVAQKIGEAERAGNKEILEEFLREFNRIAKELNAGTNR